MIARTAKTTALLLLMAVAFSGYAPAAETAGAFAAELRQALNTDLRLMCVAAHPDDEDGATLALYHKRYGLDTYAVIGTRGEGGQNEIGPELYEELAVIRTEEMLNAAKVTGAEVRSLDLPDFGYSKTLQETLDIWGREETLRRLVQVLREVRPDIIITNHGTQKDHGHHQALGLLLPEAFDAAADPAAFPEQRAEGLEPWQAARLYLRVWDDPADAVTVDIYQIDPDMGETYAEIAAQALSLHESQGMQFFIDRYRSGEVTPRYRLTKESPGGVAGATDTSAPDASLLQGLNDRIPAAWRDIAQSEATPNELMTRLVAQLESSPDFLRDRLYRALAALCGLQVRANAQSAFAIPGQPLVVEATLRHSPAHASGNVRFAVAPTEQWHFEPVVSEPVSLDEAGVTEATIGLTVPQTAPLNVPADEHVFDPGFTRPQLVVRAEMECAGQRILLERPLRVDVAPPLTVAFDRDAYLLPAARQYEMTGLLSVRGYVPEPQSGTVVLSTSAGLRPTRPRADFALKGALDAFGAEFTLEVAAEAPPRDYVLTAMAPAYDAVEHSLLRIVDVAVSEGLEVGVVKSYNENLMYVLVHAGISARWLAAEDFTPERLDPLDAVVIDIRGYHARPDLIEHNQALLDYVHRGGTLIVMYQKTYEWKPAYAPYPLRVSRNRVTREDAPVTPLVPDHPVFHYPNEISEDDWAGWIQERGLYFPDEWDRAYTPLIDINDPGEDMPPGGMLIAQHGDGIYLYTPLVWYRQLLALHPGAVRVFVNMLSLGTEPPAAPPAK